jgi:1-acyl-sn-glycerol-3-phosphate acyltransferase
LHYFAKEELFRSRWLGGFIRYLNAFPVRRGQFDRTSLAACLRVLKNEGCLLFFPEGTRAPADGFLKAKMGVGWVASLSGAQIIPAYVHGSTISRVAWRGRPRIRIIYGAAVPLADLRVEGLAGKELYESVSDQILERIRELSLRLPGAIVETKGPVYERTIIDEERLR